LFDEFGGQAKRGSPEDIHPGRKVGNVGMEFIWVHTVSGFIVKN
jgi:hypothetical protein